VRGFTGFFGLVNPPQFGFLFLAQKAQSVVPGCLGLDQLASCSVLVLWGLTRNFWSRLRKLLGYFWEFSLRFLWLIKLHQLYVCVMGWTGGF
jgi:hypothetical protein